MAEAWVDGLSQGLKRPSSPGDGPNGRRMRCAGRAGSGGTHLGVSLLLMATSYRRLTLAISGLPVWLSVGATTPSRSGLVHGHCGLGPGGYLCFSGSMALEAEQRSSARSTRFDPHRLTLRWHSL